MTNDEHGHFAMPLPSARATEPARPRPPATLRAAVWLMGVGGGCAIAWGATFAVTAKPTGTPLFGDPSTAAYQAGFAAGGAIAGLILAGLWAWMAWKSYKGKSWARIVSTVFFAVACLYSLLVALQLLVVLQRFAVPAGLLAFVSLVFAQWVVGLSALILLWLPESTQYFRGLRPVPAYAPPPPGWYPAPGSEQQAAGGTQPQDYNGRHLPSQRGARLLTNARTPSSRSLLR